MIGNPKPEPAWRSREWMAIVHEIPCVICGKHGVQAAHRNKDRGKGLKSSDATVAALCLTCHMEIDSGSHLSRSERRDRHDYAIVATFSQLMANSLILFEDWETKRDVAQILRNTLEDGEYESTAECLILTIESGLAYVDKRKLK